jgi:hypothetical protein
MKNLLKLTFLTSVFLVWQNSTCAQPVQIGYTNCVVVSNYSQTLMSEIGQLKWYFAHASVGMNMTNGLGALHTLNTNFYPFQSVSEDSNPPAITQTGLIYEYMRDNPPWQEKFDKFQTYISNGWCYPKINLAMNKLCFIDQTADVNYYIRSMTNLESAFPQTLFVYATMPLMNTTDNNNYLRNVYNDSLRDWVRTNNRVLYDIADIEAHDINGVLRTFTFSNRVCQMLCDSYQTDGGHLNTTAQQLVARGFYALCAALFAVDRDNDGMSDGKELVAGTSPTDKQSVFKVTDISRTVSGSCKIQWSSTSNRFYTLQCGTNSPSGVIFTDILVDAAGTPPSNTYTDSPSGSGPFYYRVRVRQ